MKSRSGRIGKDKVARRTVVEQLVGEPPMVFGGDEEQQLDALGGFAGIEICRTPVDHQHRRRIIHVFAVQLADHCDRVLARSDMLNLTVRSSRNGILDSSSSYAYDNLLRPFRMADPYGDARDVGGNGHLKNQFVTNLRKLDGSSWRSQ